MQVFKRIIKIPAIRNAVIMAAFYQIVFIAIFMYGYSAVPKNIDKLDVAIVNQDGEVGQTLMDSFTSQLPFNTVKVSSLEKAQEKLDKREIYFIISMPSGFTESLQKQGEKSTLDFYINEANPPLVTEAMAQVATEMTASINKEIGINGMEGTLTSLHMPADQAKELALALPNKLESNIHKTAIVPEGMNHQMAPFFLMMVSYIAAMVYSMTTGNVLLGVKQHFGKWKSFWSMQILHVLVCFFTPILGVIAYFAISGGFDWDVFVKVWLSHSLEMIVAVEFMTIFAFLFRTQAMFVNLPLMFSQVVACGAMMTTSMMPGIFKALSHVSIMFHSTQADYILLFGGSGASGHLLKLALIGVVAFILVLVVHQLLPVKKLVAKTEARAS